MIFIIFVSSAKTMKSMIQTNQCCYIEITLNKNYEIYNFCFSKTKIKKFMIFVNEPITNKQHTITKIIKITILLFAKQKL